MVLICDPPAIKRSFFPQQLFGLRSSVRYEEFLCISPSQPAVMGCSGSSNGKGPLKETQPNGFSLRVAADISSITKPGEMKFLAGLFGPFKGF